MSALEGFSAFDFSEGVPYVSFTPNGLTFNKSVTLKLGEPEHVKFLINESAKQVAIQVCDAGDKTQRYSIGRSIRCIIRPMERKRLIEHHRTDYGMEPKRDQLPCRRNSSQRGTRHRV